MNLNHLKHFYEVARSGGFSKAAKSLRTSQPNLSRSVSLLEEDLGWVLLTRNKGGVLLSQDGKRLYQRAKEIFETIEGVEKELRLGTSVFKLSIAVSENMGIHLLPEVLKRVSQKFPQLEVSIDVGTAEQIIEKVKNMESDLGFCFHDSEDPMLRVKNIASVPFVLVTKKGNTATKHELQEMTYFGSRAKDYAKAYFALSALHQYGIKPTRIVETNSQELQLSFALKGLGYTVVPKFMTADRAVSISPDFHASAKVYQITRPQLGVQQKQLIQAVAEELKAVLNSLI